MALAPPTDLHQALRESRRRQRWAVSGLLLPTLLWLVVFFTIPLAVIVIYSFLTPGQLGGVEWRFTLDNYATLFTKELYVSAYLRSLAIGLLTTLFCALLAYPLALGIVLSPPRRRALLLFLVLIPFWTNFLVRTYAWMIILSNNGLLNTLFQSLGLPRQTMLNTPWAVLLGLVYGQLPFMVLPIYASLERFDFTLMEAAADLGADQAQAFGSVMLPLTMPGVAAGAVLVFIPTVGQFVVSDLLGGAKVDLLGNLFQRLFTRSNPPNWPLGSAMSLVFMLVLTAAVVFYFRTTTEEDR
ncbi:ABC transporter permease [Chloroflexia bacterium SDU3-3]|nr:ABC transporter permease [Chloroflexia bacterium SDU3-3]